MNRNENMKFQKRQNGCGRYAPSRTLSAMAIAVLSSFAVSGAAHSAVLAQAVPAFDTLISHRGESVDAPENTLPACKMAVERGFGFECDIYLSKDGRVFTFHDQTLMRTSGGVNTKKCNDATWDEISKLDVGNWGKWKGTRFVGTRPALLEEVLELTRNGRWLYIDVKSKTADIVPYVKAIVDRQKTANPQNTLFLCGSVECGKAFKKLMPEYKVLACLNCNKGWKKNAAPESVANIIATARKMGADGVDLRFIRSVTTAAYMKAIKDAGMELHVWTIDELDDAQEAFKRGAQTVTTNCATKLLDEYKERVNRGRRDCHRK
jgi:glycerophosphoryl diester phosphodiesterase